MPTTTKTRRSTRTTRPSSDPEAEAAEALADAQAVVDAVAANSILDALAKGRWDQRSFARDVLGVDAHEGQQALFDLVIAREPDGYSPAHLTIACSAGNRAGKTLGLAIVVAHQTLYKMGLPPARYADEDTARAWTLAPYDWYHFGLSQEVSELLHQELVRILTGVHEAQKRRGCPLTEALGEDVAEWDRKERGEWAWFKWSPLLGGGEVHFRTTGERALSTLGRDMNGWSWDEPAFDANLMFIFDEVLNLRRMSTGGQAILIATSTEGSEEYHTLWSRGDPSDPARSPDYASLRMSTRQNVGYGISPEMFERMLRSVPAELVPQNIDGYFIEARAAYFARSSVDKAFSAGRDLPEYAAYERGHRYAHGIDPALTYDSTWSIVLDITDPDCWVGVSAQRRTGRQTAESIVSLAAFSHHEYAQQGQCWTAIDATGFGGKVFASLLKSAHVPATNIEFGGKSIVKQRLLNNTRAALDGGRLVLPRAGLWLILRQQLLAYKLSDRKLSTDAVMALVVAIRIALRQQYGTGKALPFDYFYPQASPRPLQSPDRAVSSAPEPPRPYVDDRALRLDSLATASVRRMSGPR
jgi:hypothetical protein